MSGAWCATCDERLADSSEFFDHLTVEHHLVIPMDERPVEMDKEDRDSE